jgi:ParB family transcriptional regulator, chromosome partitioning protein
MIRIAAPKRSRGVVRAQQSALGVEDPDAHSSLQRISVDRIDLPPRPARRFLGDIAALAESMQDYGLQHPISVRVEGERFVLTSGLRRLSAARILQWATIAAFVRTVSADHAYLLDLIENLQREDLSPEEEADALGELIRTRGWTLQQVADSVKRSVAYVSKRVRVFEDPLLREAIAIQGLPVSTAEELLASDAESRGDLIQQALVERWDQARARDALRAPEPAKNWLGEEAAGEGTASQDEEAVRGRGRSRTVESISAVRPKGLTRAVREFHRLLMDVRSEDLTHGDRAALRALFRDLVLLARSPTTPRKPVFPPMPKVSEPAKRSKTRPSPQGRSLSVVARRKSSRA